MNGFHWGETTEPCGILTFIWKYRPSRKLKIILEKFRTTYGSRTNEYLWQADRLLVPALFDEYYGFFRFDGVYLRDYISASVWGRLS